MALERRWWGKSLGSLQCKQKYKTPGHVAFYLQGNLTRYCNVIEFKICVNMRWLRWDRGCHDQTLQARWLTSQNGKCPFTPLSRLVKGNSNNNNCTSQVCLRWFDREFDSCKHWSSLSMRELPRQRVKENWSRISATNAQFACFADQLTTHPPTQARKNFNRIVQRPCRTFFNFHLEQSSRSKKLLPEQPSV